MAMGHLVGAKLVECQVLMMEIFWQRASGLVFGVCLVE